MVSLAHPAYEPILMVGRWHQGRYVRQLMIRSKLRNMNGILAVNKPSGMSSAQFLNRLQDVFTASAVFEEDLNLAKKKATEDYKTNKWTESKKAKRVASMKVKMGHGGTLDPLASGVLIVGIGLGTKKLQGFLNDCTKQYETKALLGISTTTGDSEGEIIAQNKIGHITKELALQAASKFVGDLKQTPPIFSALKLNGMPLYEYARKGIPLPSNIKVRQVHVDSIEVFEADLLSTDHEFETLQSEKDEEGNPKEHGLANNPTLNDSPLYFSTEYMNQAKEEGLSEDTPKPRLLEEGETHIEKLPIMHMKAAVSSGTYIRSLISDIGRALESSAYMVELIRTKQLNWELGRNVFELSDFTDRAEGIWGPVLKKVFEEGSLVDVRAELDAASRKIATTQTEKFGTESSVADTPKSAAANSGDESVEKPAAGSSLAAKRSFSQANM